MNARVPLTSLARPAGPPWPTGAAPGLVAQGVGVRVGASLLLQDVDLALAPGEVGAVLGPNGAGKSTLLSVLAGLRTPSTGQVWLGGVPLAGQDLSALARYRAVMSQDTAVAFDFTAREVVELGRYPHRLRPSRHEAGIVSAALALTDVQHLAERPVAGLSGGERARVQLARVLAQIWEWLPGEPARWVLLDEPTAALDLRHQHETLSVVREWARLQGVGVLTVLHDPNLALRYADRVWVLERGRLRASGLPQAVLSPELLHAVWGVRAQPVHDADGCPQLLIAPTKRSAC